jgi:hypothetical protein
MENHLFIEPQKAFEYITVANSTIHLAKAQYVYALYEIQKNNKFQILYIIIYNVILLAKLYLYIS